ncbi:hypothetical protein CALCODRAFT_65003 [Calocera cornea HHB12733]|uniref:Transmembrane protein n=1 Tax=Calocera cornea HHB12733 TaxID=1353952 RepID=A0A165DL55_9BASI|nr:hypothetical protein CALCODRAFT_65003 [Calocera cornea HHB12733]
MAPQAAPSFSGSSTAPAIASPVNSVGSSTFFQSDMETNDSVHVSSTSFSTSSRSYLTTSSPTTATSTVVITTPTPWEITTTIVTGSSTTASVVITVPSGSVIASLPSAAPDAPSAAPNSSHLSSWSAFLVALFVVVLFFLFLRLGVYLLARSAGQVTVMGSWPRWLQLMCCYRPQEDEEDNSFASSTSTYMRQSFIEASASYSEASRAQALALVREASAGSWRNRVRPPPRALSPSEADPVPPYPGPPLTLPENPFADPPAIDQVLCSEESEGNKEERSKEEERQGASGSRPSR